MKIFNFSLAIRARSGFSLDMTRKVEVVILAAYVFIIALVVLTYRVHPVFSEDVTYISLWSMAGLRQRQK